MKQGIFLCLLFFMATSCQYFDTEKVSSDTIYQEELKSIDWKEVDSYPSFANCQEIVDKPEQKSCFINTISSHLYQSVSDKNIYAIHHIYDTVLVNFTVSSNGDLRIDEIKMDTILQNEFPNLQELILKSIDSLQPVAPAYKRGIPVKTQFTLPVVIQTN